MPISWVVLLAGIIIAVFGVFIFICFCDSKSFIDREGMKRREKKAMIAIIIGIIIAFVGYAGIIFSID